MIIKKLHIESRLFSSNVLQIEEISSCFEFIESELSIISVYNPFCVQCALGSEQISLIQSMEDAGFRFIEFRIIKTLNLNNFEQINSSAFYPYQLKRIVNKEQKRKSEAMLQSSLSDDRFSSDPLISPELAKQRQFAYLQKSFNNPKKEFVYGLYNQNTNEILALRSGAYLNEQEAIFYLVASQPLGDGIRFRYMLEYQLIMELIKKGIVVLHAISSGQNTSELNYTLHGFDYKVKKTLVMLRKMYTN